VEIKALNEGLINELKSIKPDLNIEDTELPKIAQMRELALEQYVTKTIEEDGA
jgi:hypothetical protein